MDLIVTLTGLVLYSNSSLIYFVRANSHASLIRDCCQVLYYTYPTYVYLIILGVYSESTKERQVLCAMYAMYYLTEDGEGEFVKCGERKWDGKWLT